jgi:serine protease Do
MMFEDIQGAIRAVAERVGPVVVRIGEGPRRGSGILVANEQVLTNAHNVADGDETIRPIDGQPRTASVLGRDIDNDLALLRAQLDGQPVELSAGPAVLGQVVLAVAPSSSGPRITLGTVSAVGQAFRGPRGRRIVGSLEHTAAMAPGSSGSALVDMEGRLVGLNTNRLGSGLYQAIPVDEQLRARIAILAQGRDVEPPRLGIAVAPPWAARRMRGAVGLPPREGVLVRDVEAGSPAAAAGIKAGDLITAVEGRTVADPDELADAIAGAGSGNLRVELVRGETPASLDVEI